MCRFVAYLGPPLPLADLITLPANSLIYQSYASHEREEPLNGDGFGVAWYPPGDGAAPALFRAITPAWSNRNLHELARVTRSGCIFAHVRAATQVYAVSEVNCHPFTHGRYTFMHNGDVGGFAQLRRRLLNLLSDEAFGLVEGSTDSEHLFALFHDRLAELTEPDPPRALAQALRATIAQVTALSQDAGHEPCYLNLAVTDGHCAAITRYTTDSAGRAESLHITHGRRYTCHGGVCRMVDPPYGVGAVIVSSEALSEDKGWIPVPVNHMVVIGPHHAVQIEALP